MHPSKTGRWQVIPNRLKAGTQLPPIRQKALTKRSAAAPAGVGRRSLSNGPGLGWVRVFLWWVPTNALTPADRPERVAGVPPEGKSRSISMHFEGTWESRWAAQSEPPRGSCPARRSKSVRWRLMNMLTGESYETIRIMT